VSNTNRPKEALGILGFSKLGVAGGRGRAIIAAEGGWKNHQ